MKETTRKTIRILIVDDHQIVREGLRTLLEEVDDLEVVGEAGDGLKGLEEARRLGPDVILMDLVMPNMGGIEALGRFREAEVPGAILVLSSFIEDRLVRDAVEAGALGYLLKDASKSDLVSAIRSADEGRPTLHPEAQRILMQRVGKPDPTSPLDELTPRERAVLKLIANGQSNKKIASSLNLSEGTVKGYVSSILSKLYVDDRTQAALLAVREGLVPNV